MKTKPNVILMLLFALIAQFTFAQEKKISATATDQFGIPLPGVNIIIVGTTNGTQTDFDGKYFTYGFLKNKPSYTNLKIS